MNKRKQIDDDGLIAKQPKLFHEDGALKYDFMVPLQNIVMAKVINTLWMNQITRGEIVSFFHSGLVSSDSDYECKWQQIENGIISEIPELFLPKSISEALKYVVPHIGDSILNWIKYLDLCIFENNKFSKYTALNLLTNLTWTARGKIDYAETSKKMIYDQDCCLSDDHKYKLACEFCLENEIITIAPNVVDNCYLQKLNKDLHPMVYFWTSHLTDDNSNSSFSYGGTNINEFVMRLLLTNPFWRIEGEIEIAIKYIWDKLNEAEKARNLLPLIKVLGSQDFLYSLLTNLDYEQQRGIFKELSSTQLGGIFKDWLWSDYFLPTVFHILDIMKPDIYFDLIRNIQLNIIICSDMENELMYGRCKLIFKQVWKEGSKYLKFRNYDHKFEYIEELVLSLFRKQDMDIVKLLLDALSMHEKKRIIFGCAAIRRCNYLIQDDQWDLVELFFKYTSSSDEDVEFLKQLLMTFFGNQIAKKFLEQENFNKIDYFLSWILKSEEKIKQFRQSLAFTNLHKDSLSIFANSEVDFTKLEDRFKWCAQDDLEKINEFKANFLFLNSSEIFIKKLIEESRYDLLDQVLNWCFFNNQQRIVLYKSNFYKHCSLKRSVASLINNDNSLKLLDKLTSWLFSNRQEIHDFKTWLLYPVETDFDVCEYLLIEKKLELADKFINWCVTSSKCVSIFKNAYVLSVKMQHIMSAVYEDKYLLLLIKWFKPSKETTVKYKTLVQEKHYKFKLSILLDEFVESHSNLIEDDLESVSQS